MLTLLFVICMIAVFGKLAVLALKGAWGLTKIVFSLIFLPLILIGLVIKGLLILAFPVLLIAGVIFLISELQTGRI